MNLWPHDPIPGGATPIGTLYSALGRSGFAWTADYHDSPFLPWSFDAVTLECALFEAQREAA